MTIEPLLNSNNAADIPSYKRGFTTQAPLAIAGCLLGLIAWWQTKELGFLIGAIAMLANWPWTLLVIMRTNNALMATDVAAAGPKSTALVVKWVHSMPS